MIRMFDRNEREEEVELLAFVNPEPENDAAVRQAVDTLAHRAVAAWFDAGERRDWWPGIGDVAQARVDVRVQDLLRELDPSGRQYNAAVKLLEGINS